MRRLPPAAPAPAPAAALPAALAAAAAAAAVASAAASAAALVPASAMPTASSTHGGNRAYQACDVAWQHAPVINEGNRTASPQPETPTPAPTIVFLQRLVQPLFKLVDQLLKVALGDVCQPNQLLPAGQQRAGGRESKPKGAMREREISRDGGSRGQVTVAAGQPQHMAPVTPTQRSAASAPKEVPSLLVPAAARTRVALAAAAGPHRLALCARGRLLAAAAAAGAVAAQEPLQVLLHFVVQLLKVVLRLALQRRQAGQAQEPAREQQGGVEHRETHTYRTAARVALLNICGCRCRLLVARQATQAAAPINRPCPPGLQTALEHPTPTNSPPG